MTPKVILNKVFGYDHFRDNQEAIIQSIITKNDTLIIMPTGGGKSLCYQIPALIFERITIVISPLISLMKDQVEQLQELGIKATFLNSTLAFEEYQNRIRAIESGNIKLLYVAPETLMLPRTIQLLKKIKVDCFAIDEAHCISEWGHDFRPEYRQIAALTQEFENAVVVGATATATPRVQQDIVYNLKLTDPKQFISSFDRKNLFIEVKPKVDQLTQLMQFIDQFKKESGLIYCFSRKKVEAVSNFLQGEGLSARPYHAGLSGDERKENQELFIRDDVKIVVATVAFGMGIDKPNIRYVVHFDLPKDIETYYQQIGRAGRDGLASHCLLFFSHGDIGKIKYFIGQKSDDQQRKIAYNHLDAILEFCETRNCRRKLILEYFGEEYEKDNCETCDNCTQEKEALQDLTIPAQKFLSCVKRVDEMFGTNHIVDILRGSKNKKILSKQHDQLSTYGIGTEISKKQWQFLARQLLRKEYLFRDALYGSLRLNDKAWDLLKSREKFYGQLDVQLQKQRADLQAFNTELFDQLRHQRKNLADAANVPPYVIFSDKSLAEMAQYFPQSKNNFLKIYGVGEVKYKKYGDRFMALIQDFCQANNLQEVKRYSAPKKSTKKKRYIEIGEQINQGKEIDDICHAYKIKEQTVVNHLYHYLLENHSLRENLDLPVNIPEKEQNDIIKVFDRHGTEQLKPVFQEFDGQFGWPLLHKMRVKYLMGKIA